MVLPGRFLRAAVSLAGECGLVLSRSIHPAAVRGAEDDQGVRDQVGDRRLPVDRCAGRLGDVFPAQPRPVGSLRRCHIVHHSHGDTVMSGNT